MAGQKSSEEYHKQLVSLLDYPYWNKRHLVHVLGEFGCIYSNGAVTDLANSILARLQEKGRDPGELIEQLEYARSNYFLRTTQFASHWFPFNGEDVDLAKVKAAIKASYKFKKAGETVETSELHDWTVNQLVDGYEGGFRVLFVRFRQKPKTDIDTGLQFVEPDLEKRHVIVRPHGIEIRGADTDDAAELIEELNSHLARAGRKAQVDIGQADGDPLLVATKARLDAILDDLGAELTYYSGFAGATCKAKGIWSEQDHDDLQQRCLRVRSQVVADLVPFLNAPLHEAAFQLRFAHPVGSYVEGPIRVHVSARGIRFLGSISEAALNRIWGSLIDADGGQLGQGPQPAARKPRA